MAEFEIRDRLATVWVVWRDEHPPDGGHPVFLAAYDGACAEASANALVELVKLAGASGQIVASPVPLWPLLKSTA